MFRHFIYRIKDLFRSARREIYDEALNRIHFYRDINIDSEGGLLHIREYINCMHIDIFLGDL